MGAENAVTLQELTLTRLAHMDRRRASVQELIAFYQRVIDQNDAFTTTDYLRDRTALLDLTDRAQYQKEAARALRRRRIVVFMDNIGDLRKPREDADRSTASWGRGTARLK